MNEKNVITSPQFKLTSITVLALSCIVLMIYFAVQIPLLTPELKVGVKIQSNSKSMIIENLDQTPEPNDILSSSDLDKFYQRQQTLFDLTSSNESLVAFDNQTGPLVIHSRQFNNLPFLFWVQIFVGFCTLMISGCLWALRPNNLSTKLFFSSGLSVFVSAITSAVYTTRTSALMQPLFQILVKLNALSASTFGISVIVLFMVYPLKIKKWVAWSRWTFTFFSLWTLAALFQVTPKLAGIQVVLVVQLIIILFLICVQFFITRTDPRARAALVWLGLSIIVGAGAFVVFNSLPSALGIPPLNQGYAFTFFLIMYLGLAAGIAKYRLFEAGAWAFRLLFYTLGVLVFILLDAAFILVFNLERFPSLGLSLLAIGFLYLPLRDYLWNFFSKRKQMSSNELFSRSLFVAFSPTRKIKIERWQQLLKEIFDPLQVKITSSSNESVEILSDGLELVVPRIQTIPAFKISYPWAGKSLFSKESLLLSQQLVSVIKQVESSRDAYDRGVLEERRRMAQDLHDDLGSKLLSGLHVSDAKTRPLIEDAIDEMKSIVSAISGESASFLSICGEIRHEVIRRLTAANIRLDWPLSEDPSLSPVLEYKYQKAVRAILREAVSNVIRHAQATEMKIFIELNGAVINFFIQDNGRGFDFENFPNSTSNFGLSGMKRRILNLGGSIHFETSKGCIIRISIPLNNM